MNALVLLSGGMDSTVCLQLAIEKSDRCTAIGFDYGQLHIAELDAAKSIAESSGVPFMVMDAHNLGTPNPEGDPVVPNRNAILLSLAAAVAIRGGLDTLVIGACASDYDLFPDCRPEFIQSFQNVLQAAGYNIRVWAPLLDHSKADVWREAERRGVLELVRDHTVSCYRADLTEHEWGRGCGSCVACIARAEGWAAR